MAVGLGVLFLVVMLTPLRNLFALESARPAEVSVVAGEVDLDTFFSSSDLRSSAARRLPFAANTIPP